MMLGKGERLDSVCVCAVLRVLILSLTEYKRTLIGTVQHHGLGCYRNLVPVCLASRLMDSGTWTRRGIADYSVYPLKKYSITSDSSHYLCYLYEIVWKTSILKQIKAHSELSGRPGNKMLI